MKKIFCILFLSFCIVGIYAQDTNNKNYLKFSGGKDLYQYFAYKNDGTILVSGHRGGLAKMYPENSIEGLQNVLNHMPAIFEIDPRLTKDSVIVLMHDATLDRTTNAKGRLADYTWDELKDVRLKDHEGNITPYKIPRLEDVIVWSKGKTVINLDKKDVPLNMIADLIKKHEAQDHVMLTVHTGAQARFYYDRFPHIMFSVFARTDKEYEDMSISGVPWQNMIAYVGPTIDKKNEYIVKKLRANGVRCMVSYAPTLDKLDTVEKRKEAYKEEIKTKPDIIESDIPVEIWAVLNEKE